MTSKPDILKNYDLSNFLKVCDSISNLMISIFELQKQKFLYYNRTVNEILGYSPDFMKDGGWGLWYSLMNASERTVIKQKLLEFITLESFEKRNRLLILKYHINNAMKKKLSIKHEVRLKKFADKILAVSYIQDCSEKELIENYLGSPRQKPLRLFLSKTKVIISDREKQVLKLIGCGLSSKQIADKLFISIHTAISHRKNLIDKFGVKNTAELIKEASKVIAL